jgi:predicted aspartyl protease
MNSYNKGNKIIFDIIIYNSNGNGYKFKCLLDTGSDITFITNKIFTQLNLKETSSGTMIVGNNNKTSIKMSKLNISFINHTKYVSVSAGVIPNKKGFDVILGMDIISYCNIKIITTNLGFDFDLELPSCK